MLLYYISYYIDEATKCMLFFLLIIFACTGYTYMVNLRRKPDDPKKREYHPFAIILAPFALVLLLSLGIFALILRALLFGCFLVIFTILLIAIRKPFIFELWHKFATKIGDPLLKIGTQLIKIAFSPWTRKSLPA